MSAIPQEPHILLSGLVMGEAPRWRENRLWCTDMGAGEVLAVDLTGTRAGQAEVVARVPSLGLGFLSDGRLLIVSLHDGLLLRRERDGTLVTHADLMSLSRWPWNDLVVDGRDNAYVGNLGFEYPTGAFTPTGTLALVAPDGSVRQVAEGLAFPNGMAVTPDNTTLLVAESYGARLTAFDIAADGSLSHQRVWADLPDGHPDGICLDADGAVWYADVPAKRCVRVRAGGEMLQAIALDRGCFACTLGGIDRRTLYIMAAAFPEAASGAGTRTGQVVTVEAPAPGAGWP